MKIRFLLLSLALFTARLDAFDLVSSTHTSAVSILASEPECVRLAVADLIGDAKKITGQTLPLTPNIQEAGVLIASMNHPESVTLIEKISPGFGNSLKGKWEAYRVEIIAGKLIIAGSDERGTMFGIYHFIEEMLGVDPLYFWSGLEPEKRDTLAWETVKLSAGEPTFRFRGWFINDEDLLTEWMEGGGKRNIQYPFYSQTVNPMIMRAVAESLVRSRCNMIIPASFIDILNPPEKVLLDECARRGVFLTQHHIEPMGVNAFAYFNYWKKRGKDLKYSYFSQRDEVLEVWRAYATEWAKFPNVIWQTGLRGIGDRPMWMADKDTPQSDADRGALISDAMVEQMKILNEICPGGPKFSSTTLWAEGSVLNQKGHLTLPENMTVVFADNSPGWKWQADFYSTPRNPKNTYGVYYHHGLIGSGPHLAQVPSPNQTYQAMKIAVDHQASEYAVMNVGNIREFVLGIAATADMTRDMEHFDPDQWLRDWSAKRFPAKAAEVNRAYHIYFNSWSIHPTQGVPFLMDGQMFGGGHNDLSEIAGKLKAGKIGTGTQPEDDRQTTPPPVLRDPHAVGEGDAFHVGLSDMHPRGLPRRETAKYLAAQLTGLQFARDHGASALKGLESDQARFLNDNLVYHSEIMIRTSLWYLHSAFAAEDLDLGNLKGCVSNLTIALDAFDDIPELAESQYLHGKWENWYRGCKKLNIDAHLDATRKTLAAAEETLSKQSK